MPSKDLSQPQIFSDEPRVGAKFPFFEVEDLGDGDALITCPKKRGRCGNGFIVNYEAWVKSSTSKGRACPYCFKAASIPKEEY